VFFPFLKKRKEPKEKTSRKNCVFPLACLVSGGFNRAQNKTEDYKESFFFGSFFFSKKKEQKGHGKERYTMKTKRFLSALLAACLTAALVLPATAAGTAASLEEAAQAVTALGIMSGDGGGLNLSAKVTRAEFVTMAIKASPGGDGVGQAASSPYPDVPRGHWASGYVEAAVARGLATAYSDGTFRPDREVTLAEAASMVLALLGYGPGDFSGAYPTGQLAMYHSLKLDQGVTAVGAGSVLTRQDAVFLFYNLLSAKTKAGAPYIQQLGHSLDASGKPDVVSLINGQMEGPIVAQGYWESALGFVPGKVYRNGSTAVLGSIQDYDVVYWNASMGTVWAYAQKATGPIQALTPSGAEPTSVTVAGRTYAIESSAAAYALSDLGGYHLGDNVTLLLGRNGGVAAVTDVSAAAGTRVGVVVEVSKASYPDGKGGSYTAQTVTLLGTDGQTYQYQGRGGYSKGSVVRVVAGQSGEISLRGLGGASLSGQVSRDGTKLDKYAFAPGAEILDVSDNRGAVVYPSRLAGLKLDRGQVRWYALNPQGEIETLILNDVTGDAYQYGVLTGMSEEGEGMYRYCTYSYDLGGVPYTLPNTTTRFRLDGVGLRVLGDPTDPDRLSSLKATKAGQVSGNQLVVGSERYTLSDQVLVYEYRDNRYYLSTLARAEDSQAVTGWYDKAEAQGGRVRVLVVKE